MRHRRPQAWTRGNTCPPLAQTKRDTCPPLAWTGGGPALHGKFTRLDSLHLQHFRSHKKYQKSLPQDTFYGSEYIQIAIGALPGPHWGSLQSSSVVFKGSEWSGQKGRWEEKGRRRGQGWRGKRGSRLVRIPAGAYGMRWTTHMLQLLHWTQIFMILRINQSN